MTQTSRSRRATSRARPLEDLVTAALDDMKAVNVKVIDVRGLTDIADTFVIASGNSDRHVRSIADRVVQQARSAGFRPHGLEGQRDSEWVLVDLTDVIVHVMLPRTREFYGLERLWDASHGGAVNGSASTRAKPARAAAARSPRRTARPRAPARVH
jgi:ribosome-associated protein